MAQIEKGLEYLKSIPSILKIIEFVVLLAAIGTVGYFLDKAPSLFFDVYGQKGKVQFFMASVVIGWVMVMALFSLFITGLHEKVSGINWLLCVAIISAIGAVLLLISSALVADTVRIYETKKTYTVYGIPVKLQYPVCDILDRSKVDYQCGHLIGGTVCAFIAMVFFTLDAIIHFRMWRTGEPIPKASAPAVST